MIADSELGLMVNPFPLNPEDIIDVGGWVAPDFEERVNCDNHVMEDHESGFSQHFCGVHKAIIPIARMRELVDEDDTTDTIPYRCPTAVNAWYARDLGKELLYHCKKLPNKRSLNLV